MRIVVFVALYFICGFLYPQKGSSSFKKTNDSLRVLLKATKQDTSVVSALNKLSQLFERSNPDTALLLAEQSLILSQKLKYKKGEAWAAYQMGRTYYILQNLELSTEYSKRALKLCGEMEAYKNPKDVLSMKRLIGKINNLIGNVYLAQSDYPKALSNYATGLKISEEEGDKHQACAIYSNIGIVYHHLGDYPKELEYYLKALKLAKEVGNENQIRMTLSNLGAVYCKQLNYTKALEYYLSALKMNEEVGDKYGIIASYVNIGLVYKAQGDYNKALTYYFKSIKMAEEVGDRTNLAIANGNMAAVYEAQGKYSIALQYYSKSFTICKELNNKQGLSITLGNIGNIYRILGKYKEAESNLKKALYISKEIGAEDDERRQYNYLSSLYEETKRPSLALECYKKYISLRDSIFSEENTKKLIRSEINNEYEKQTLLNEVKHQKEIERQKVIAEAKNQKQKVITYSIALVLLLVLVLALFIFRSNRQKQRANQIIIRQKKEVETQKYLIEEKHKEITDSINYAERIQRSFLSTKEFLDTNLKDYFILFNPKDIVSGDFYWATKINNSKGAEKFALLTADSTGHGVPGAIMSLLNITSLESAIKDGFTEPSDILNATRKTIIERLKKDGSKNGGKDGMDASLICFDFANNKFTYAAANNPIWVVRLGELIELKPDKMPVGKHDKDTIEFTQHEFEMQKGDVIYTLTDGFPDQFGGPKGKKFMYKQLKELLILISQQPLETQKQLLLGTLTAWKGDMQQVDDICLIGIRV